MASLEQIRDIAVASPSKIVFLVMDGLGGLPHSHTGRTELESAHTPNLDRLAREGICGLADPVQAGITPGSGPGHLALFGYNPLQFMIGRGVLEALGIGVELEEGDVAVRGNFCTVDEDGVVTDRRAGRISSEKCADLCRRLDRMRVRDAQVFVYPVREHRFVVIFRGSDLYPHLADSDPQQTGALPKKVAALSQEAKKAAGIANEFVDQARNLLATEHPANMVLLRGFARHPQFPSVGEIYKLNAAAIAVYPMYRGLARLVGMTVLECGMSLEGELDTLADRYAEYDFFFVHVKHTDSAGEDGDFQRKVAAIEETDAALPRITRLNPEVLVVTGDHSTPALLKGHSWHPVPFVLYSKWCRPDGLDKFGERACVRGSLGRFPLCQAMPLALAHALKLTKFGA